MNTLQSAFVATKKFVKNNWFACLCLVLALLVFATGTLSYSKYVSSDGNNGMSGAANFSSSAKIDGVSALSFTNTAFWGGTAEEDKIAMNALRTVTFSVNNFKTDSEGNKKVSDVRLQYNLTFSSPKSFAEKLALQVFDSADKPLVPQMVVSDIIAAASKTPNTYNTASSKDYNGTPALHELSFTVTYDATNKTFTAVSGDVVVRIEQYTKTVQQELLFRMWDTSDITTTENPTMNNEAGDLMPPVTVNYTQEVEFFRISVTMGSFVLPAGEEKTVQHAVKLAPTNTIVDNHLGGNIHQVTDSATNAVTTPIQTLYGGTNDKWTIRTVNEKVSDNYYNSADFSGDLIAKEDSEYTVIGNEKVYQVGDTGSELTSTTQKVDETLTSGTTTKESEGAEGEIEWDSFVLDSSVNEGEIKKNHKNNTNQYYVSQAVRKTNEYRTVFYVYKIPVIGTGTQTITKTTVETKIVSMNVSEKRNDVSEEYRVSEIVNNSDGTQTIQQTVKKDTKIVNLGIASLQITTTTTKVTRIYTQKGYIYRAYYIDSSTKSVVNYDIADDRTLVGVSLGSAVDTTTNAGTSGLSLTGKTYTTETFFPYEKSDAEYSAPTQVGDDQEQAGTQTTTTQTVNDELYSYETSTTQYIQRTIDRTYNDTDIVIDSVVWAQLNESGNPIYDEGVLQTKQFTKDDPLRFFQNESGVDRQIFYIAQCYSKSFPFFVNVVFEQIQL